MAILELRNLDKSFGGLHAVDRVSCAFPAGRITSVIGPNGAGKTTLFNLATGFLRPDSGRVILDGQDITGLPPHKVVAAGMSRTFQLVRVFPRLTLVENLLAGCLHLPGNTLFQAVFSFRKDQKLYREKVEQARGMLEYVGLTPYADAMANDLSYGQQKLVEIARAMLSEPRVLLIDEPLAGLNVAMIEKMLRLIDGIKREGKTIILIEHNTDIVKEISDQIVVLNFGKVIANGPPRDVFERKEVIDSYLGINTKTKNDRS